MNLKGDPVRSYQDKVNRAVCGIKHHPLLQGSQSNTATSSVETGGGEQFQEKDALSLLERNMLLFHPKQT